LANHILKHPESSYAGHGQKIVCNTSTYEFCNTAIKITNSLITSAIVSLQHGTDRTGNSVQLTWVMIGMNSGGPAAGTWRKGTSPFQRGL
jgi:hypothetical protein